MRAREWHAGYGLFVLGLALPLPALAASTPLVLELVLNGRATGELGQFVERDGQLLALPDELRSLGFVVPQGATEELMPLSALTDVRVHLNRPSQTLEVTARDDALQPTMLEARQPRAAPFSPSEWGLMTNYDVSATQTNAQASGGALVEMRGLSPYGSLSNEEQYEIQPTSGARPRVRLNTTYTYPDPDETRRWRAGDVVAGALSWTRAVRLGGAQVATDFGMRPDLVTYPLPAFYGSAAVPSTVDLMINGVQAYSNSVQSGPFEVHSLPSVNGAGEAVVAVTNALGVQTLTTVPFYIASDLLKSGLTSYSLEGGAARHSYGLASDSYGSGAFSASTRHGLTDWLTVEGHGEATDGIGTAGAGVAVRVGMLGVLSGAAAVSHGQRGDGFVLAGPASGALFSVGFQRATRHYSISASATQASQGYRDVATAEGSAHPRQTVVVNFGLPLGRLGALNLTYINRHSGALRLTSGHLPDWSTGSAASYGQQLVSQVSLGYSVPLTRDVLFMASSYMDPHNHSRFGVLAGLTFLLGDTSVNAGVSAQNHSVNSQFSAQKAAVSPGDFGYLVNDSEGASTQRMAQAEYVTPWGRVTAGASQYANDWAGRVGVSGAVVAMGGGIFASDHISDSFAVVSTGDLSGVRVNSENRAAGKTDSSGLLLVPNLQGYSNNRLAIDPDDVPPDYDVRRPVVEVRPGEYSGVKVDFGVRATSPAVLRIVLPDGRPVPLRSQVRVAGGPPVPVGHDGLAFVTGLGATNTAEVKLPSGHRCRVRFHFQHVPGEIPTIGPLRCES